ncbi:recombination regulator RecX [Corynebacterium sp. 320]|uniref:Regulatory protein RecX n=1 Tax=Corynebacterium zhongnanshanii TaxID=2768834 RepID=A0ABQ6VG47_9CORY|nr:MULTISPECIES: recombination regulator RecX [Corynebacterium]KAB1503765.1 recombination regulator RecX [Corynebacterium sp. 320]KAB1553135.1 recombination regulator RecX [Corynebacterium sp. 321]KAB1553647.1 recombination regulator RecX [Corynebacterium sp. 319]KAB3523384.1 recombination regulator RecX [Corynebacterium zhongnanshanii]KAB3527901.1 recombination regulator RecX [Corynebacterium sp. 250]
MVKPSAEKIAQLRSAIEHWDSQHSEPLIDHDEEERLAPIKRKAVALINHRARSSSELRSRLLDQGFEEPLVDRVVNLCLSNGMIDDQSFAREWVRQRSRNQKKSAAVLRRELAQKGISERQIEDALELIDEGQQQSIMEELIDKKAQSLTHSPADRKEYDKFLRRMVGVAARRGFPQGASVAYAKVALERRIDELGQP